MKVLCATHSSRPFMEARCQLNSLEQRFADRKLIDLPPLETFRGADMAVQHSGALTLWEIKETTSTTSLCHLATYDPGYKIQSATFLGNNLIVYGSDRIEVLGPGFEIIRTITDPWLVGGHTVFPCSAHEVWVTCAPANAVMKVNIETGEIVERLIMPDQFGRGYPLDPDDSMHEYYIPTDFQPTHVNCAVPAGDDLLVTLWIPGSLGILKPDGRFKEIATGYRGAHGGNWHPTKDNIVTLADSPSGIIWFFDSQTGNVVHRIDTSSQWLHDAQIIAPGIIATSHGDTNIIRLIDENSGENLSEYNVEAFGRSSMFVNGSEAGDDWTAFLAHSAIENPHVEIERPEMHLDENLVISPLMSMHINDPGQVADTRLRFSSQKPLNMEIIQVIDTLKLRPGDYLFEAQAETFKGSVSIGLLDTVEDSWCSQLIFDSVREEQRDIIQILKPATFQIIAAACNQNGAAPVDAYLKSLSLCKIKLSQWKFPLANRIRRVFRARFPLLSSLLFNTRYKR